MVLLLSSANKIFDIVKILSINKYIYFIKNNAFKKISLNDLYKKWGFVKADYIDNIEEVIALHRLNPDESNDIWVSKNNENYYHRSPT